MARVGICALTALLGWGGALLAQEQPATNAGSAEQQDSLQTVVTLDYRDTDIREVVDYIARRARQSIVVDPEVEAKVTIALIDVPWQKALQLVCQQSGTVYRQDGPVYHVSKPPKVTMNFRDADIRVVVEVIAKLSNANIIVADDVEGTVNVHLKDVPWDVALDNIVKTANFTVVRETNGIIRIVDPSSLEAQMETSVFKLRYFHPPAKYNAKIQTNFAEYQKPNLESATDPEKFDLYLALKGVSTDKGSLTYEPMQNMFIAKDTVPVLNQMRKIIEQYDVPPRQVYVEVRFVRTSLTDDFEFGVDYPNGVNISNSMGSLLTRLPFNLGEGGWEDKISLDPDGPTDAQLADWLTEWAQTTGSYSFGTLSFSELNTTLRFLEENVDTEIIQAPRLLALDNQDATIFVGETIRFVEQEVSTDQFGNPTISLREARSSPVSVGFQLLVRSRIVPETDQVIMMVIPAFQTLTGTGESIAGFDHYESGDISLDLPRVGSETVITNMLLEDGMTGVIGGLLNTSTTKTQRKIPFVGDIPVLGRLFRYDGESVDSRNLLIFVTPHIVRTAEETRQRTRQAAQERHDSLLQDQIDRLEGMHSDDTNLDGLNDKNPTGHGILSPEEIEELKRKYNLK